MTTPLASNCLHRALSFILLGRSEAEPFGDVTVIDYADPDQFAEIWKLQFAPRKRIVIVWTETALDPDLSPINAADCLSPIDWAVCYAAQNARGVEALSEVCILDMRPEQHACIPAVSRLGALKPDLLPWLRIHQGANLAAIVEHLSKPRPRDPARCEDGIRRFLRDMRMELTEPKSGATFDRHAAANIIGPMILRGKAARRTLHSDALQRLLETCGLVSGLADESASQEAAAENHKELSFLLVDDQADHGWADWVRDCLPGSEIRTMSDPSALVESVRQQMDTTAGSGSGDLRFRLALPDLDKKCSPVLLLDLRLFSGRPAQELRFYRDQLLPLIDKYFLDKPNLAWPSFSSASQRFKVAVGAIQDGTLSADTPEHFETLTWLPRVLSLADLSLPIVVFSSTGRRDLVQSLHPYRNIITDFSKPRLSGQTDACRNNIAAIRHEAVQALRDAVSKAMRWTQGRSVTRSVLNVDLSPLQLARDAFKGKTHIEIYHDEASRPEEKYFRVVSLVAGFDNRSSANTYDEKFTPRFYGSSALPKYVASGVDREEIKRASVDRWTKNIKPSLDANDAPALLLAILGKGSEAPLGSAPEKHFDPKCLDNVNWDLLRLLWESLLCDVIPAVADFAAATNAKTASSIYIFGATRKRAVRLNASSPDDALLEAKRLLQSLDAKWGIRRSGTDAFVIDSKDKKVNDGAAQSLIRKARDNSQYNPPFRLLWESLGRESFHTLVSDAMFSRQSAPGFSLVSDSIGKALGTTLTYSPGATKTTSRHLHYIADILAGLWDDSHISASPPSLRMLAESGFSTADRKAIASVRARLMMITSAQRLLDNRGCVPDALAIYGALPEHPVDLVYLVLVERLRQFLPGIKGWEFERLCALVESKPAWHFEPS